MSANDLSVVVPPQVLDAIAQRAAEIVGTHTPPEAAPYMTVEEAAEFLRCGRKRVYDLTSQRRLPYVKDGSRTLLRRVDLIAYLEGSE
jgi:excisionase family DNA binding protein